MKTLSQFLITSILVVSFVIFVGVLSLFRTDINKADIDPLYMNKASQIITLSSGQKVHLRIEGNPKAPTLVLLHGSNASLHSFEAWVKELGKDYRLISFDLPGHGLTGPHIENDYSRQAYIDFVNQMVRFLRLDLFVLGGSSMGGDISWRYALAYPQKLRGLILIDSGGYYDDVHDIPLIFSLLRYGFFRWLFQKIYLRSLTEQGLKQSFHNDELVTDKLIQRYEDLNLRSGQRRASALRFAEQVNNPPPPPPANRINVPTLILWGREDRLSFVKKAQWFHRDFPNSTLVIYDDVGHLPQEEIPKRSAQDVHLFLEATFWSK